MPGTPATVAQQRDAIVAIAPPWLQNESPPLNGATLGVGGRFLYNIGLADDALLEKLNQAMKGHMPTVCDASCLPYLGNDRVLTQGPTETTAAFRLRLQNAFQSWQLAGERQTVMEQVAVYMGGLLDTQDDNPIMSIVGGYHARQWSMYYVESDTTEPPNLVRLTSTNFDWDGLGGIRWWRNWLVFYNSLVSASITGSTATMAGASGNFFHLTGLSGVTGVSAFTTYVTITGAATAGNNGTFQVTVVNSATNIHYANPQGSYPDANSGSLSWSLSTFPNLAPMPVWGAPGITWGLDPNQAYGLQSVGDTINVSTFLVALRNLMRLWKSAQTYYDSIIFSWFGGDGTSGYEFSPYSTESTGNPGGLWGANPDISTTDAYGNPLNSGSVGYGPFYVASRNTGQNSQLSAMVAVTDGTAVYQLCTVPTGT